MKQPVLLDPCSQAVSKSRDAPRTECQSTATATRANGEVCDEGVCYGNPPTGTSPRRSRADRSATTSSSTDQQVLLIPQRRLTWRDLQLERRASFSRPRRDVLRSPLTCDDDIASQPKLAI